MNTDLVFWGGIFHNDILESIGKNPMNQGRILFNAIGNKINRMLGDT
jgi:hypothetical protein